MAYDSVSNVKIQAAAPISPLHREARRLAQAGTPVFPCKPGSKKPATENGFHDASTDLAKIDAWWGAEPEYNIAFSPHSVGLSVVDLDGAAAHDEWAEREIEHGFAGETYSVLTPRAGGQHLYFKGELPPTQHKLGQHIDTRGRGSYALVPPSVIDVRGEPDNPEKWGTYRVEQGEIGSAAPVPEWIAPFLEALKRDRVKAAAGVEMDTPGNLARATKLLSDYVAQGKVAVSGEGGNSETFIVACKVQNLGVSPDAAFKLLSDHWNPACQPPWSDEELDTIVQNAARYAQNEAGAWAVGSASEVFGPVLGSLGLDKPQAEPGPSPAPSRIILRNEAMQDSRPPMTWLVEGFLPDKSTVGLHAPFNQFKSFAATDVALSVASGRPALGYLRVHRQGPVIYMLGEGAAGFETQRRPAWRVGRGIEPDERLPIYTVEGVPQVRSDDDVAEYMAAVRGLGIAPALVVIDTMSRAMAGLNENDAGDAGRYLNVADGMVREFGCAVLTVMHEGKDEGRGVRGSSAFAAGFDVVWKMEADTAALTARMTPVKLKDDASPEPIHLRGRQVTTPNGKSSLVFDLIPKDVWSQSKGRRIITHADVGRALVSLGAINGQTVQTQVLAVAVAGPDADDNRVDAVKKTLNREAKGKFEGFVSFVGRAGVSTLWTVEPDRT